MNNKLSTVDFDYFETLCHESIELPMDIEYFLPDYCPDIQKILKCDASVDLSAYSFTQDRMMCEGKLTLHVRYMDENSKEVRVCDIVREFSHSKEYPNSEDKTLGRIKAGVGHIVCRAISARKLDIHLPIVLSLDVTVFRKTKVNFDAQDLEMKTEKICVSHAVNAINHMFVIEQSSQLAQTSKPIDCILRKEIEINSAKCTLLGDKIELEGVADICMIYRPFSESPSVEKMTFTVPFTQSIDAGFVNPECISNYEVDVCEFSLQPKEDSSGEYTICDIYVRMRACIFVFQNKEIDVITDAYSTKNQTKMNYKEINFSQFQNDYKEKLSFSKNIFLSDDELEKMLDFWCEDVNVNTYCEKNKTTYRGKFCISLLYKGKSGGVYSVTKNFDFTQIREFSEPAQRKCDAVVKVKIRDYRIVDGNNIEFNCDVVLESADYTYTSKRMLENCECAEEKLYKNKIRVYYSQNGEGLWDIGKKYASSVADIIQNNKLSDDLHSPGGALIIY